MKESTDTKGLLSFLAESPSPFHAAQQAKKRLEAAGFQELKEEDPWPENLVGKFWVTRNDSSIIAFSLTSELESLGLRLLGAHTDSPGLKVKPKPDEKKQDHWTLGIETYGGVLLATWFDRDLSLAGRVSYVDHQGGLNNQLLNVTEPIAVIPSLAIHLRRNANDGWTINPQKELSPILSIPGGAKADLKAYLKNIISDAADILDYDLFFYDHQPPQIIGVEQEMIASARLDNLVSCYGAIEAMVNHQGPASAMMILNDHEEVGSGTAAGAAGNFLESVLERILVSPERKAKVLAKSYLMSVDNAHAVHPNYADMHDPNHAPVFGAGPVIKSNANQSYITDSETSARFQQICQNRNVPYQHFSIRADLRCGSTIGPLTVRRIGIKGVDIGIPNLGMHSIRELIAQKDLSYLIEAMKGWVSDQ